MKVYLVIEYCYLTESDWISCAFDSEEKAQTYIAQCKNTTDRFSLDNLSFTIQVLEVQ